MIGGAAGIGKATLAYRLARFVLAHPDPSAPGVQAATTLDVAPEHPVARRIVRDAAEQIDELVRRLSECGASRVALLGGLA